MHHTLFFLPIFVILSILALVIALIVPPLYRFVRSTFFAPKYELIDQDDEDETDELPSPPPAMPSRGLVSDLRAHIRSFKEYGSLLFALEVLRTLCLGALIGLSVYAAIKAESPESQSGEGLIELLKKKKKGKGRHKGHHDKSTLDDYSSLEWGEFGVCIFYVSIRRQACR